MVSLGLSILEFGGAVGALFLFADRPLIAVIMTFCCMLLTYADGSFGWSRARWRHP